jgi:Rrf2 family cysteine metabolism transcriptional repressor
MKLSTKGQYGLLAVIDLALNAGNIPIQSFQIAERQNIPKQYLDQLLLILKKSGLIASSRGRQGGYRLARPPQEITLYDVVLVLEGPIEDTKIWQTNSNVEDSAHTLLSQIWNDMTKHAIKVLKQSTLEDFCESHRRIRDQLMYHI